MVTALTIKFPAMHAGGSKRGDFSKNSNLELEFPRTRPNPLIRLSGSGFLSAIGFRASDFGSKPSATHSLRMETVRLQGKLP